MGKRQKLSAMIAAALYALSVLVVSFSVSHFQPANHAAQGADAPTTVAAVSELCHSHTQGDGDHGAAMQCCDACLLNAAPGVAAAPINHLIYILEIAERLDFASRLGRDSDAKPDNLRSRAPPVLA